MSTDITNTVTPEAESIRATLFGKHYVQIDRLSNDSAWTETVHALNWFNTRSIHLYNFYNLVAGRSVTKVGGVPIFKGKLIKQLVGKERDRRSVLLVVKYPSPIHFKTMLENTYFKLVSVLRAIAVKQFTFCLSKMVIELDRVPIEKDSACFAVHHFRGNEQVITEAQSAIKSTNVECVFASVKTHQLKSVNSKNEAEPVPDVMDGILLFRASTSGDLENLVKSASYQSLLEKTDSSFVGLLERLM